MRLLHYLYYVTMFLTIDRHAGLQNKAREREGRKERKREKASRNPGQWLTRYGLIVNPNCCKERVQEGKPKEDRWEKLVAVYVVSEGYYVMLRGALTGNFPLPRFLLSSVPRNSSTYRHPSSRDALPRKWYVRVKTTKPTRAATPTNGSRTNLFPRDSRSNYKVERTYIRFSRTMYQNVFRIILNN